MGGTSSSIAQAQATAMERSLSRQSRSSHLEGIENESGNDFNVRQTMHSKGNSSTSHETSVRKRLFATPGHHNHRVSILNSAKRLKPKNDTITKKFYQSQRSEIYQTPRQPPKSPTSSHRSTIRSKKPSIASIPGHSTIKRKYGSVRPAFWGKKQQSYLLAWLNHELNPKCIATKYLPSENIATSAIFIDQIKAMQTLFQKTAFKRPLNRIKTEIAKARFFISRDIRMLKHIDPRNHLITLILTNYHPNWLLLGLSVLCGANIAQDLDKAFTSARESGDTFQPDKVFMSVLEEAIVTKFLANDISETDRVSMSASKKNLSPQSRNHEQYNALVLYRFLSLVYLLDYAKTFPTKVIKQNPPLFRTSSEISSSEDLLKKFEERFLKEQGDAVRFLKQRNYVLKYKRSFLETKDFLFTKDISKDLCDGIRLGKLASIMIDDSEILEKLDEPLSVDSIKASSINIKNVSIAMDAMQSSSEGQVAWKALPRDIATGNVDQTVRLLWQVIRIWMDTKVLRKDRLETELEKVKNQYRAILKERNSPSAERPLAELSPMKESPSRLQIHEHCQSESSRLLIQWIAVICAMYGVRVTDYTESFRDGAVLCLLLHHYNPQLIDIGEFTRVRAKELRVESNAELEAAQVTENFSLFMSRCQPLGAIPDIKISAEEAMASCFISMEKADSFGRAMELISSYLFNKLVIQRETSQSTITYEEPTPFKYEGNLNMPDKENSMRNGNDIITPAREVPTFDIQRQITMSSSLSETETEGVDHSLINPYETENIVLKQNSTGNIGNDRSLGKSNLPETNLQLDVIAKKDNLTDQARNGQQQILSANRKATQIAVDSDNAVVDYNLNSDVPKIAKDLSIVVPPPNVEIIAHPVAFEVGANPSRSVIENVIGEIGADQGDLPSSIVARFPFNGYEKRRDLQQTLASINTEADEQISDHEMDANHNEPDVSSSPMHANYTEQEESFKETMLRDCIPQLDEASSFSRSLLKDTETLLTTCKNYCHELGEFQDKMFQHEKDAEKTKRELSLQQQTNTSDLPSKTEGLGSKVLKTIGTAVASGLDEARKQYGTQLVKALEEARNQFEASMAHAEARDTQLERQRQKIQRLEANLRKTQADLLNHQSAVQETEKAIEELNDRWDTELSGSADPQDSLHFSLTPRRKELMITPKRKMSWEDEENRLYLEALKESEDIAKNVDNLQEQDVLFTSSVTAIEDQHGRELQEKQDEVEAMKQRFLETLLNLAESRYDLDMETSQNERDVNEQRRVEVLQVPVRLQEIDEELVQLENESMRDAKAVEYIEEISSEIVIPTIFSHGGDHDEDELLCFCETAAEESRQFDSYLEEAEKTCLQVVDELQDKMNEVKILDEACQWDESIDYSGDELYDNGFYALEVSSPTENPTATVTEQSSTIERHDSPRNSRGEDLEKSIQQKSDVPREIEPVVGLDQANGIQAADQTESMADQILEEEEYSLFEELNENNSLIVEPSTPCEDENDPNQQISMTEGLCPSPIPIATDLERISCLDPNYHSCDLVEDQYQEMNAPRPEGHIDEQNSVDFSDRSESVLGSMNQLSRGDNEEANYTLSESTNDIDSQLSELNEDVLETLDTEEEPSALNTPMMVAHQLADMSLGHNIKPTEDVSTNAEPSDCIEHYEDSQNSASRDSFAELLDDNEQEYDEVSKSGSSEYGFEDSDDETEKLFDDIITGKHSLSPGINLQNEITRLEEYGAHSPADHVKSSPDIPHTTSETVDMHSESMGVQQNVSALPYLVNDHVTQDRVEDENSEHIARDSMVSASQFDEDFDRLSFENDDLEPGYDGSDEYMVEELPVAHYELHPEVDHDYDEVENVPPTLTNLLKHDEHQNEDADKLGGETEFPIIETYSGVHSRKISRPWRVERNEAYNFENEPNALDATNIPYESNEDQRDNAVFIEEKYNSSGQVEAQTPQPNTCTPRRQNILNNGNVTKEQSAGPSLSAELAEFGLEPTNIETVLRNPSSAEKLKSVMRRISTASASPVGRVANTRREHMDLVRTVFIVIRQCARAPEHISLVNLSLNIIQDICQTKQHVPHVIAIDDCVDVLTTCVQFYRDNKDILEAAVNTLWQISTNADGEKLILSNVGALRRLSVVNDIVSMSVVRVRTNMRRTKLAEIAKDVIKRRNQDSKLSLSEEISFEREKCTLGDPPLANASRILRELVESLSFKSDTDRVI